MGDDGLKAGCVEIIYFTRRSSRRPKKNATLRPLGERGAPSTHSLSHLSPIGAKIAHRSQMALRNKRSRRRCTCQVLMHRVNGTLWPISRVMITRDCKRSTTLSSCEIFAFPMGSMFPARALTSGRTPSLASPMKTRAFTPLAVADHRSLAVPDHPRPT